MVKSEILFPGPLSKPVGGPGLFTFALGAVADIFLILCGPRQPSSRLDVRKADPVKRERRGWVVCVACRAGSGACPGPDPGPGEGYLSSISWPADHVVLYCD